jgi:hypothetical protein
MGTESSPSLLVDTSSLLRANLDRFDPSRIERDAAHVVQALVLFDRVYLDGPSVERNLARLSWTLDIDPGVQVLEIENDNVSALYQRGSSLSGHIAPWDGTHDYLRMHVPEELVSEIGSRRWAPSTYWSHLEGLALPPELQKMKAALDDGFDNAGTGHPFSGAAFVALARLCYYLALQEEIGSVLMLDKLKSYIRSASHDDPLEEFGSPEDSSDPAVRYGRVAHRILGMFDSQVSNAFEERRLKWLGGHERDLSVPLLARYIVNQSKERGWSLGRTISAMRESHEVKQFRLGLVELLNYEAAADNRGMDEVFETLEAAADEWSKRLGVPVNRRSFKVTAALPLVEPQFTIPTPRLRGRRPGERLLVLISELLQRA